MNEQIEEIAKVIARRSADFRNRNVAFMTTAQKTATEIYHKLCNKQSEGEWIYPDYYSIHRYDCSLCGAGNNQKTPYCPNCGAKMKGVKYDRP